MTIQELKFLISALRAETQEDSVSPDSLGALLIKIVDLIEGVTSLSPLKRIDIIASTSLLPQNPNSEEKSTLYLVDGDLYVYKDNHWQNAGTIRGPQGLPGENGADGVLLDPEATAIFDELSSLDGKTAAQKHAMVPSGRVIDTIETQIANVSPTFSSGENVGGMTVFDDLEDLEMFNEAQAEQMLPSGKAVRLCEKSTTEDVPSASWITGSVKGAVSGTKYARYESWDYPKFIPINEAKKLIVTTGAYRAHVALVTNTTMSNGGAVPFAEGEATNRTLAANGTYWLKVPGDAVYLFSAQKTGENWAFPTSVKCVYTTQRNVDNLRSDMNAELAIYDEKKQDKTYPVDLTNADIIASRDDINSNANNQRTTLRMQRVFKGDVFKVIKPGGAGSGTMLVRTFNKGKTQTAQTGWISQYTILQDGYATVVVNSNTTNGGTTQFLLDALTHTRSIQDIVKEYLDLKWKKDNDELVFNRLLQNDSKKYLPFEGISPFANTLTWSAYLPTHAGGNQ